VAHGGTVKSSSEDRATTVVVRMAPVARIDRHERGRTVQWATDQRWMAVVARRRRRASNVVHTRRPRCRARQRPYLRTSSRRLYSKNGYVLTAL
jgi:hypothetical protein